MDTDRFAKGTERLVDPVTVGSIHFLRTGTSGLCREACSARC